MDVGKDVVTATHNNHTNEASTETPSTNEKNKVNHDNVGNYVVTAT